MAPSYMTDIISFFHKNDYYHYITHIMITIPLDPLNIIFWKRNPTHSFKDSFIILQCVSIEWETLYYKKFS